MKIAAILETNISSGGGFNQALNAIVQMSALCQDKYEFAVLTNLQENVQYLKTLNIHGILFKGIMRDLWLVYSATHPVLQRLQAKIRLQGNLEKVLLASNVDLAYFVEPGNRCLSLQQTNYIQTVWDLCHRDTPEFPEVRSYNEFLKREHIYSHSLAQSLLTITDSASLSKKIFSRYGVDEERLLEMPFSPSPFLNQNQSLSKDKILLKYHLKKGYFYYPAQFWAHKNHIRILEALDLLNRKGLHLNVVFSGGDKGNYDYIKDRVTQLGLEEQVVFLGFVPVEDIKGLYEACTAVIMPSYFGPTNLPPLEAWMLNKPLLYSDLFKQQAGEAALFFNPDSAQELSDVMEQVLNPDISQLLVSKGRQRLMEINEKRQNAEKELLLRLKTFEKRLRCWKQ